MISSLMLTLFLACTSEAEPDFGGGGSSGDTGSGSDTGDGGASGTDTGDTGDTGTGDTGDTGDGPTPRRRCTCATGATPSTFGLLVLVAGLALVRRRR